MCSVVISENSKDVFMQNGLSSFLRRHEIGVGVDKAGCNYHDQARWYMLGSVNKFEELRDHVVCSIETGGEHTRCFLNDIAPNTSRLFIDLDINKKDERVSEREFEEFVMGFYRGVSNGVLQELFHFPDPTPQIEAVNSSMTSFPFGWFEIEDETVHKDDMVLEDIIKKVDPATMIVLKSKIASDGPFGPHYYTYHIICPFLIGPRKRAKNGLMQLIDPKSEYSRWMRQIDSTILDKILHISILEFSTRDI